jgi:hypothetical protein
MTPRRCDWCTKPYLAPTVRSRHCSPFCQRTHWRARNAPKLAAQYVRRYAKLAHLSPDEALTEFQGSDPLYAAANAYLSAHNLPRYSDWANDLRETYVRAMLAGENPEQAVRRFGAQERGYRIRKVSLYGDRGELIEPTHLSAAEVENRGLRPIPAMMPGSRHSGPAEDDEAL